MATYSTNELRPGLKVLLEGDPSSILSAEFVKPGKGQAFYRVKFRNLITGRVWDRTLRSGETVESAEVVEHDMDLLYDDGQLWHFMRADETYEQLAVDGDAVGEARQWISAQDRCTVTIWQGRAISVVPPNFVELEVAATDPGVRGDTARGGTKPATLSTGAVLQVPLFVNQGEFVRVDTRTGQYVGRARD